MKIQVSMPDSRGTFAGQSIEAEENAQVLFASFLPVAGLVENPQPSEITQNTGSDLAGDMSSIALNLSEGFKQGGLNDDSSLIDTSMAKVSDAGISLEVPDNLPANHRFDTALSMLQRGETVLPQTTTNQIPNVVEQLNTVSDDLDNVLNTESRVDPVMVMLADRAMFKKTDLMTDEPTPVEKQLTVDEFAAKDRVPARTMQEPVLPSIPDFANTKMDIFSSHMPGHSDESKQELTTDNMSMRVNEKDSVNTLTNVTEHPAQPDRHSFDSMLTNVADFLNKRLDATATSTQNKSGDAISLNTAANRELDNNSALKAFQYNSNGLPASLKVDSYFATLKVYPPDLGQVTADIQINKGMTELTLRADNPHVRHFIESNLPQLRDSFENSHIHLGEVTIQNNSSESRRDFQNNQQASYGNVSVQQKQEDARAGIPARKQSSNLIIDTYA